MSAEVTLVAHTVIHTFPEEWISQPEDPDYETDLDLLPEIGGRLCYEAWNRPNPDTENNEGYISNILRRGHGSVLEHSSVTFLLRGVSRTLTHELVRQRAGASYSQRSQRYVDEGDADFTTPRGALEGSESLALVRILDEAHSVASEAYRALVRVKETELAADHPEMSRRDRRIASRQLARAVLPGAVETAILVTMNLRAWRHFLRMRGSLHAEPEIRALAVQLAKKLIDIAPNVFQDVEIHLDENRVPYLKLAHNT